MCVCMCVYIYIYIYIYISSSQQCDESLVEAGLERDAGNIKAITVDFHHLEIVNDRQMHMCTAAMNQDTAGGKHEYCPDLKWTLPRKTKPD